jgi:hypothetical protein
MGDPIRRANVRGYLARTRDGLTLGRVMAVVSCDDEVPAVHLDIDTRHADDDAPSPDAEHALRVLALFDEVDEDARVVVLSDAATLGLGTATAGLATTRARSSAGEWRSNDGRRA